MQEGYDFFPKRKNGVLFHLGVLIGMLSLSVWGIWKVLHPAPSTNIFPIILLVFLAFAVAVLFAYRLYTLLTVVYRLEREGIRLRWGLRREDLPMEHILGVERPKTLGMRFPLPPIRWPGSVLGVRKDTVYGEIDFLATNTRDLVFIVTERKAYAISPHKVEDFIQVFQHFAEMGTLTSLEAVSTPPAQVLAQIWKDKIARILVCVMLLFSLLFLGWVEWRFALSPDVEMGFQTPAMSGEMVYSRSWRLLPWLNILFQVVNFFTSLVVMWSKKSIVYAYLVWSIGLISMALFIYLTLLWIK